MFQLYFVVFNKFYEIIKFVDIQTITLMLKNVHN